MSDRRAKRGRILPAPEVQDAGRPRAAEASPEAPARRTFLRRATLLGGGLVGTGSALRTDRAAAEDLAIVKRILAGSK